MQSSCCSPSSFFGSILSRTLCSPCLGPAQDANENAANGEERNGETEEEEEEEDIAIIVTQQPASSSSGSARTHRSLHIRNSSLQREQRKNRRTVLCFSPTRPQEGQVDLLPRSWCFYEEQSFMDVVWKLCFCVCCCPLCYPCYVSRSLRLRGKMREEKKWREIRQQDRQRSLDLLKKSSDEMNRTLFRQVSEGKRKRSRKLNVNNNDDDVNDVEQQKDKIAEEVEEEKAKVEEEVKVSVDGAKVSKEAEPETKEEAAAESDDDDDSNVINVNVILLHSESSVLLHKYLATVVLPNCGGSITSIHSDCSAEFPDGKAKSKFLTVPDHRNSIRPAAVATKEQQEVEQHQTIAARRRSKRCGSQQQQQFSLELSAVQEDTDDDVDAVNEDVPDSVFADASEQDEFEDCVSLILECEDEKGEDKENGRRPSVVVFRERETAERPRPAAVSAGESFRRLFSVRRKASASSPATEASGESGAMLSSSSPSSTSPRVRWRRRSSKMRPDALGDQGEKEADAAAVNGQVMQAAAAVGTDEGRTTKLIAREDNAGGDVSPAREERKSSVSRKSSLLARVSLRRSSSILRGMRPSFRRRRRGVTSSARGDNIFYSLEPQYFEDEDALQGQRREERIVQMRDLGHRTELVRDLGYQFSFSVYDEATVSEWKGCDLRLANEMPNMDLIVLVVRQNHLSELNSVMSTRSGMMSYFSKFWRGFYPLLLIELLSDESIEENPEFSVRLARLEFFFGDVHHIQVPESELELHMDWITECMARLFIHARLYQCSRFYGDRLAQLQQCPGGCELRKQRLRERKLSRKRPLRFKGGQRDVYRRSKIAMV